MCLAIPGKVVCLRGEELERVATVAFAGIEKDINLSFVPEAKVGDYVLVHAGIALGCIDSGEAQRVLALFEPATNEALTGEAITDKKKRP